MRRSEFDAERAVLACVLADGASYWQVADLVAEDDFQQADLRSIWRIAVAQAKAGEPTDAVTLGEIRPALAEVALSIQANTVASLRNVRAYAGLLGQRGLERKIRQVGQRIAQLSGEDVLGEAQRLLATCVPRGGSAVGTLGEFADQSMAEILSKAESDAEMVGVPTGYEDLDQLTGGWQKTDLIIVAARPSVGKTAFALQSSLHAACQNRPTMFISLEMSGKQLTDRALAHLGGINSLHIRTPKQMEEWEWPALTAAKAKADTLPFRIDESPNATVDAIAARVRQVNAEHRLELVVIDYLTYIRPPKANTVADAIQEITRALKGLAKELQIPVVLLSQLNREGEGAPALKHLRDSGAIEQDADVVLFLHRPDQGDRDLIKVTVGKQRNGPLGEFCLRADMARMRFHATDDMPRQRPVADGFDSLKPRRASAAAHRAGVDA